MRVTHERCSNSTDTWLTPPSIIKSLGEFDLDPCTPDFMPWQTAKHRYTEYDNGLIQPWFGSVWCNPPYSNIQQWLQRCSEYMKCIALVFARTETKAFHQWVWPKADSIFFFEKRITFYSGTGIKAMNAGAPSVLVAYDEKHSQRIADSGLSGKHLPVRYTPIIVVGISPTWISVVNIAISNTDSQDLTVLYETIERLAPDKVAKNKHWKAKIRQSIYTIRKTKSNVTCTN